MRGLKRVFVGILTLGAALLLASGAAAQDSASLSDDEKRFVICAAVTSMQGQQWHRRWLEQGKTAQPQEAAENTARSFWHYIQALESRLGAERTTQELTEQKAWLQQRLQAQRLPVANLQELSDSCQRLSDSWETRGLVSAEQVEQAKSFARQAWKQAQSGPATAMATQGTAFVVAPGHLLTNAHVVRGAQRITVVSPDGRRHEAQWLADAPDADLALLRAPVEAAPLPLALNTDPEIGQEVFALGHPLVDTLGFTQKAAFGRVSAVPASGSPLFQTDLQVQPGFSGGPLLDGAGQVLGVVTSTVNQRETLASRGVTASNVAFSSRLTWAIPWLKAQLPEHPWGAMSAAKPQKSPKPPKALTEVIRGTQPSVFLVEAIR